VGGGGGGGGGERTNPLTKKQGGPVSLRHDFEIQERGEQVNPVAEV
jgi:hypothetical protein